MSDISWMFVVGFVLGGFLGRGIVWGIVTVWDRWIVGRWAYQWWERDDV